MTRTLDPALPQAPQVRRKPRRAWWLLLLAAATLPMLGYLLSAYLPPDIEASRVAMFGNHTHYALLLGHIGFASIALVTGLLQFWPTLRRKYPKVHRWTGRAYMYAGIFPSILFAVPLATMSITGVSHIMAFYVLIGLWAWTGVAGLLAARQRRFADHRKWMIRNYSLTVVSGIMSRPIGVIMTFIVFSQSDSMSYQGNVVAMVHDMASGGLWLTLLLNVAFVELYIYRRYGYRPAPARR